MAKPKVISLNKIVDDLDATREALEDVVKKEKGKVKEELKLKIRKLKSIRRELTALCKNGFPVYPPSGY
jgi:predicted DNA-binding protein YlxM (UPF0122 family)